MKCPDCQDGYVHLFNSRERCETCDGTNEVAQPDFNIKGTQTARMSSAEYTGYDLTEFGRAANAAMPDAFTAHSLGRRHVKPIEWARMAQELLRRHPEWTPHDLAEKIKVSVGFLAERLSLLRLHPDIRPLVDSGAICRINAVLLTNIPQHHQSEFVKAACGASDDFRTLYEEVYGTRTPIQTIRHNDREYPIRPELPALKAINDQCFCRGTGQIRTQIYKSPSGVRTSITPCLNCRDRNAFSEPKGDKVMTQGQMDEFVENTFRRLNDEMS